MSSPCPFGARGATGRLRFRLPPAWPAVAPSAPLPRRNLKTRPASPAPASPHDGPAPSGATARRPRLPAGALLVVFIDLAGFSIIFPLFPAMLEHYLGPGASGPLAGLASLPALSAGGRWADVLFGGALGSLYAFCQFLAAPFWGALSDRHGRRPVLLVTCAGTAVAHLLWIFAGSLEVLVGARLLAGLMAGNLSVATAAVADATPPERRAASMGILGAVFGLGFIFGPVLGAAAAALDPTAWPALAGLPGLNPFSAAAALAALLATINLLQVAGRFRETLAPDRRRHVGWGERLALGAWRTLTAGSRRAAVVALAYQAAFAGMEFTLAFLVADRFGFGPGSTGLLLGYVGILIVFTQGIYVRRQAPRIGEKALVTHGLAAVAAGLLLAAWAPAVGWMALALAFLAFGAGCANAGLTALASLHAPADRQGAALGIFRSAGSLARTLGPLAGGVLYWWAGAPLAYAAAALTILLAWLVFRKLPASPHLPPR